MVRRLAQAPATIGELAAPFEMSLPAASKHIRVLERAGLVKRSIEGREHHCTLVQRRLRDANAWIVRYTELWESTLDALEKFAEDEP